MNTEETAEYKARTNLYKKACQYADFVNGTNNSVDVAMMVANELEEAATEFAMTPTPTR